MLEKVGSIIIYKLVEKPYNTFFDYIAYIVCMNQNITKILIK